MAPFSALPALLGGALIGLAAVLLMFFAGRIAGVSGIIGGCLTSAAGDRLWRWAFVAGLILAPFAAAGAGYAPVIPTLPGSWSALVVAGLFVGFGARLGGGCTSGHGVCGMARISPRSIAATCLFMASAFAVVTIARHVLGG